MTIVELRDRWIQRRAVLGECGDDRAVKIIDRFLVDLADMAETDTTAALTLTAASVLCGYSRRHLARLVKNGTIPNVGRPKAPKIRPSDLPLKLSALRLSTKVDSLETARGRIAKSVINHISKG